jgi:excisionase family DNA binding protein
MTFIDIQRRLLTLDEIASTLGLSRRTVERRVKAGEIPALQLGGPRTAIRVPADELDAWLESEPQDAASWLRGF